MSPILIATHNQGKLREIMEVLHATGLAFTSLKEQGIFEDVAETGTTHEENALIKARYFQGKTGLPTIAEDSGIYVDAFPGDFGVYTRRWKGLHAASDETWIAEFLKEIAALPGKKRTARFMCCAVFLETPTSEPRYFVGETRGIITPELRAPLINGIPISSCFIPDGFNQVYASLSVEEKNKISHRGKAMHQLAVYLKSL